MSGIWRISDTKNSVYSDEWKEKGNEWYKKGNYIEASGCYKRAIELNPGSDSARHNLGMTYNKLSRLEDSESYNKQVDETFFRHEDHPRRETWNPFELALSFIIVALLIWIIRILYTPEYPGSIIFYYGTIIVALIALCFVIVGLIKFFRGRLTIRKKASFSPGPAISDVQSSRVLRPLSSSAMNIRTWIFFFLICLVALTWGVFLHDQGMMLWVGIVLALIVTGFNAVFIFTRG